MRDHGDAGHGRRLDPEAEEVAERVVAARAPRRCVRAPASSARRAGCAPRGSFQRENFAARRRRRGGLPRRALDAAPLGARRARVGCAAGPAGGRGRRAARDPRRRAQPGGRARRSPSRCPSGRASARWSAWSPSSTTRTRPGCSRALLPLLDARRLHAARRTRARCRRRRSRASRSSSAARRRRSCRTRARRCERARELAGPEGAVLVTGSIYLLADLAREPGAASASTL